MRPFRLTLLATIALAGTRGVAQQPTQQATAIDPRVALSDSAIRAVIKERVDAKRSSGIAVGILDPDGHTRVFAYGTSGTSRPLDANSVFEIGSITKTFTATTLADMAAKGEVMLDDPVAKYLPSGSKVPSRNGREITLVDLATQSSGLPRMPTNFHPKDPTNPYADYTEQQAIDFVSSYQLTRDVGAEYEYSNLGMGLLGIALARREGVSYEDLVRKHVLDPFGMTDTRVVFTPSMKERLALGHDEAGSVVSTWDIPGLAGAGRFSGVSSTSPRRTPTAYRTGTRRRSSSATAFATSGIRAETSTSGSPGTFSRLRLAGALPGTTAAPAAIGPSLVSTTHAMLASSSSRTATRASMTSDCISSIRGCRSRPLRRRLRGPRSRSRLRCSIATWATMSSRQTFTS